MHFEIQERERSVVAGIKGRLMGGSDWRWRLVDTEGKVVASGDGYATCSQCEKAVFELKQKIAAAPIEIVGR